MKLTSIKDFAERNDRTQESLHSLAFYHRNTHGSNPDWYVYDGNTYSIDEQKFFKFKSIEERAWNYCTEELYWLFTYSPFQMCERTLARKMAERSHKFKSVNSWCSFFNQKLFMIGEKPLHKNYTMTLDFIRNGTELMQIMIRESKDGRHFDQREYDRRTKQNKNNKPGDTALFSRWLYWYEETYDGLAEL